MMSYDYYYGVAVAADDGVRLLANSLRHALSPFILSALPVPMLRQVYVEPWKGRRWAPPGPPRAALEFSWAPLGRPSDGKNGDFAWEVLQKWQAGDVKRTC